MVKKTTRTEDEKIEADLDKKQEMIWTKWSKSSGFHVGNKLKKRLVQLGQGFFVHFFENELVNESRKPEFLHF